MLNRIRLISGLFALALGAGSAANVPTERLEPVFIAGGQYTAVLNQEAGQWRLLPGDGIDLVIDAEGAACDSGGRLPAGIWLVTSDAHGRPMLSAPSVTALPPAHPEHVALRACGSAEVSGPHLDVPQGMLDWLTANTGAIYVED